MFSLYSLFGQLSSPVSSMHIERRSTNYLHCAAVSVHGWRGGMEDSHNICLQLNDNGLMLWGVYDGHGGPRCAQYLAHQIPIALRAIKDIRHDHEIAAIFANLDRTFLRDSQTDDGSTACIVLAQWWDRDRSMPLTDPPADYSAATHPAIALKLLAINVGDSRATIISSDSSPKKTTILTRDHKPQDPIEYQRIVAAGGSVINERVDGTLALSRSFGDKNYKTNDNLPLNQQKVISLPDITTHYLLPGQMLVVCCDGLFEAEDMDYEMFTRVCGASREHYSTLVPIPSSTPTTTQHDHLHHATKQIPNTHPDAIPSYTNLTPQQCENAVNLVKRGKKIVNFDPAGIGRDLIVKSHELGSKDNHTAVVIHFCPSAFGPMHPDGFEYIPGPCHSLNPDTTFLRSYRTDISPMVKFEDVIPKIQATDYDFLQYCTWEEEFTQFCQQLKTDYNWQLDNVGKGSMIWGDDGPNLGLDEDREGVKCGIEDALSSSSRREQDPPNSSGAYGMITAGFGNRGQVSRPQMVLKKVLTSQFDELVKAAQFEMVHPNKTNHSSVPNHSTPTKKLKNHSESGDSSVQSGSFKSKDHGEHDNRNNKKEETCEQGNESNEKNESKQTQTRSVFVVDEDIGEPIMLTTQSAPVANEFSQSISTPAKSQQPVVQQSGSLLNPKMYPSFESKVINLGYPLPYFGLYPPTGTSIMPFYFPSSRSQYPEWLDAFIQHSLSHGDDCDYY